MQEAQHEQHISREAAVSPFVSTQDAFRHSWVVGYLWLGSAESQNTQTLGKTDDWKTNASCVDMGNGIHLTSVIKVARVGLTVAMVKQRIAWVIAIQIFASQLMCCSDERL